MRIEFEISDKLLEVMNKNGISKEQLQKDLINESIEDYIKDVIDAKEIESLSDDDMKAYNLEEIKSELGLED